MGSTNSDAPSVVNLNLPDPSAADENLENGGQANHDSEQQPFMPESRLTQLEMDHNVISDLTSIQRRLYVSHTIATWNSRMFEFGAVLFLSTIYPDTLLPASIYALSRAFAAVLLSSWIGKIVDTTSRIVVVRMSIGRSFRS